MKNSHSSLSPSTSVHPFWRIGIVHASFYKVEVEVLVAGARKILEQAGVHPSAIKTYAVPGSFEIPLIGEALAQTGEVDALIGLGIIVQGETHHAELIAAEAARGCMDVQLRHRIPFAFEILHVDNLDLARARLKRGEDAARAVLHSLVLLNQIQ